MKRAITIAAGALAIILVGCGGSAGASAQPTGALATQTSSPSGPPSQSAATPRASSASTDAAVAATHMVAAIDNLAALVAADMDLHGFVLSEGQWAAENITKDLASSEPAIHDYVGAMIDLAQAVADLADTSVPAAAIIATRSPLARLAGVAEATARPTPAPATTVVVRGKGDQKTKPFTMPGGDFSVVMAGTSDGNVFAELFERGGDPLDSELLINEISHKKFRYETALYEVSPGSYYLDIGVDCECAWTVTFTPLA